MTASLPQGELTIARMCALAGVSRAGYYRHWAASAPRQEETGVRDAIQRLALAHPHYGYRRIAAQLRREGLAVNHKRVLRLMREDNLLCLRKRAFVPVTTDSRHGWRVVPNLARGMAPTGLDQLWVADITYIRLQEEFAFLAIVLDAFSRRVIGWGLDTHLRASLAIDALNMAIAARRPAPGSLIHHSDRGVQYACGDYAAVLEARDIQPSMSRIGNPYDNAKAESFMKTLKQEEVDGRSYRDAHHAREMIGSFIEEVYNRQRLHSALAYQSPAEFEANLHAEGALSTASRSLATALWGARSRAACYAEPNYQPGAEVATKQTPIATCP
jgi:putative transposase